MNSDFAVDVYLRCRTAHMAIEAAMREGQDNAADFSRVRDDLAAAWDSVASAMTTCIRESLKPDEMRILDGRARKTQLLDNPGLTRATVTA